MSNELATHLACVLNAFDMHFNALKTLPSFTSLNEIKSKKNYFRLNPQRLNVLKMLLNAEKLQAFKPVAIKLI